MAKKNINTCECCGRQFVGGPNKLYCSKECKKLIEKQLLELHRTRQHAKRRATESDKAIMAVNTAARKAGLSYGKYVARNEGS